MKFIKKQILLGILFVFLFNMSACGMNDYANTKIKNQEEQFNQVEQDLQDLKILKVRLISPERMDRIRQLIYDNYFRGRNDREHCKEEVEDEKYYTLIHETEQDYELLEWSDHNVYYYSDEGNREEDIYSETDDDIIDKETGKLLSLIGLPYNDRGNGYEIDQIAVNGDKSVQVFVKRYIGGKELSIADSDQNMDYNVDKIKLDFAENQIIGIDISYLTETQEIENDTEDILVDSPQKAYKLVDNYIKSYIGGDAGEVVTMRVRYVTFSCDDTIYTLKPKVEFYTKYSVYQVDLSTKNVEQNCWVSFTSPYENTTTEDFYLK